MKKIYFASLQKSDFTTVFLPKFLLIFFVLMAGVFQSAKSQVTLTATGGAPVGGPWTTLKAAFDAINAGTHQGVIVISIAAPGTTEAAMAVLNSSGTGAANYTSVTVNPTAAGVTVTGNLTTSIVKLNGADNVTINGLFAGVRNLTFTNSSTGTTSTVIWVGSASAADGATNNTISNCIITGTSSTYACIMQSSGVTVGNQAETANSNNTYNNNLVHTGFNGIGINGPAAGNELNTTITNNTVGSTTPAQKFGLKAIQVFNQQNVVIASNNIFGVNSTSGNGTNQASGIDVRGIISGGSIDGNIISDIVISGFWGCNGIQLFSSSSSTGLTVSNNFIFDVHAGGFTSANSVDDGGFGIALDGGGGYNIHYNSIRLSTNQNSGISAAFWVGPVVGNGNNIRNNIFSNQQSANTRYSFYSNSPNTVFSTINYNDYYNLGTNLGFLGSNLANLAALQGATGQDANSFSTDPGYTSATNLHLLGSSALNALGTPIAGITRDIDGDTRDVSTPDVGADEFTPPNCTTNNGGTASASSTSICASGSVTLSSTGYSFGLGIAYQWEYFNGSIWQNLAGQTNPTSASTGVITATTSYRLRVTCNAGAPGYSNVVVVTVNNPTVSGTTPGSRCGIGTVNLAATGTNLKWYDVPTGGTAIGTGSPFTTPVISATTTYYVSASVNGSPVSGGKPSTNGADGTNPTGGIRFTVTEPFVLNSVVMYPTGAGTNTINLYAGTNTSGTPIFTLNHTFAGANPSGETVAIGWTIPPGSYTIFQSVSGAACWRDFSGSVVPAIAYPYNIGTAVTLTDGSLSGFYYFFYNWNITPSCEGTRTAVTATVTAPPAISPTVTPGATVCEGTSVNLNVTSSNAGYSYVWNPGSLSGAAQTVTPAGSTAYIVTATDASAGPFNGCVNQATVNVTVNPVPTPLVISPSVANVCASPIITTITATGGLLNNQSIFTELFEAAFASTQFVVGGSGVSAARNTTYFSQGTSSVRLTYTDNCNGDIRNNANINLTTLTNPTLSFYHICALERSPFDFGWVEYSTDAGTNWTTFPTSAYSGTGTTYNGVVSFSTGSYSDWDAQFSSDASDPGTGPATSLWKKETINLSAYQSFSQFRIRFRITSDGSVIYNGWYIDSVNIKGTGQAPITWSPATDLYTNPGATIPYTLGTPLSTVYTKPTGSITYTATATGGAGCNRTGTATLTVTSVAVGVTIAANPGNVICDGTSVTFTATPVNGGTTPFYTWQVNGGTVASGIGLNTYTTSTLANTDQVRVILLSNVGSCATNNPATSNVITMTVNPNPAVNITGGNTVCNGAPPTVLTANATIASGTIATYEWFIGGVSQGAPSPSNTFNATVAGAYTVTATSAAGCPTTSAVFNVTLPTYTITASAGPNGSISPSGSVVVNCGDNQTFTITPNGGFAIQDVIVDGVPQGPIGTYTFTNVTANGHTISATFFIAGCPVPPTANAGANASFCANQTYTLNGSVGGSATAGSWSGGTGTYNPNANTLNAVYTPSAAEIAAGTVTLTLTSNNPNGAPCVPSTSSVTLTIKEIPTVSISGILGFCASGSTTLTANATINPVGPITYQWNYNPGNISLGTAVTQTSSQGAGTYSVTATGNGCSNSASEIVALFASPTVSITGSNLICTGTPTTLSANATAGSGVISAYQWKLGGVDIGGATSPTFATTLPGNYTLQVTNSNGCSTTSAVHVLAVDNSPLNGNYTIGAGPASCTNYISFASAINDLNTRTISGNVRFDVVAGYTETVPVGGLALGSVALNATVSGRTISFLKNGVGANPLLTAFAGGTATPSTNASDGIFSLRGVDNVSIDRIDLVDPNTTNPSTMEYGYGLFKLSASDGAQNNTISNCTITLNRVNNGSAVLPMFEGSTGIAVMNSTATAAVTPLTPTGANGTNSNNKFYGNTIINCNNGIGLSGYGAASPFTLGDTGNDVGGSSVSEGNTILNYGGGGTQPAAGIRALNQWGVNISFNTLNNNNGSGVTHTAQIRGIYGQSGTSASATINNNNIDLKGAGTTQVIYGIDNNIGSTAASNTITINNNVVTAAYPTATTGGIVGIINNATPSTLNMSGNTVQNCTQTGTGPFVVISNNAIVATVAMNDNIVTGNTIVSNGAYTGVATITGATNLSMNGNIITNNTKTNGTSTTVYLLNANGSTNSSVNNNTITGNTLIASATNVEFAAINQGLSIYTFNNNFISNNAITGVSGTSQMTVTGYRNVSAAVNETVTNNTIRRLFITGTSTGLQTVQAINLNTGAASVKTISGNIIDTLYTGSGLTANIYGIRNATGTTVNIFRNKIHSLHPGQSATAGSYAAGIRLTSGSGNIYNNMIGLDYSKAFAPAANSVVTNADGLKGIEFTGTTGTWNIYFNSIHLKGAGGTGFGSSAISQTAATAPVLNLRNNILDNQATPNGGRAVAFRRGTNSLVNYAATSNNNSFYAGSASANNLLYFDGTNAPQNIAAYLAIPGIGARESASISGTTAFVDPPYDLHLDPANNCDKDAGGAAISGYTTDYDGDTRNATNPDMGCDEFDPTGSGSPIWKGVNTDWTDVLNWCGAVPISTTNVSIPAGRANYPTITTNTPVCGNINIASGGSVTITGAGQLTIHGTITNAGTFNVADGTIELAGSSAQTIPASAFVGNNIKNLIINNATVNLGGALNLTGKLSFTGSNRTFATAGNLTLKSSATATASVGDITNNGTNTGNQITGDVLVERHIMAVRAWRLLAPPTQHNLQTIKEAWQENQAANATTPAGFGIQITSDRASWSTDGFDLSTPAGSSVKTYNPATNQYVGIISTVNVVAPTASNGRFEQGKAYMTFIRGDRTVNTFPAAPTTTVLREKGALITNNFVFPGGVGAGQFAAVGNPYASAIDFSKVYADATGIQNVYYLWDPQLGTLGGYRTFAGPGYTAVPPGGSYSSGNKFIESGSGFFVHSSGPAGTVTFKETHKVDGSNLVTRVNNGPQKLLYTNLYQVSNGTSKLFDGVLNEYDPAYADGVDDQDGIKLNNFGETLGLTAGDQLLVIDRKSEIKATDTIFYKLGQVRAQSYQFEFIPQNVGDYGVEAFLEDVYLNTKTPVSLSDTTRISFNVINEPGSYDANRFRMVFKLLAPVPVTFTDIRADKQQKNVLVSWKVENEVNIREYAIERSTDGRNFTQVATKAATGNNGASVSYSWLDVQAAVGANFYRVRSLGQAGDTKLSRVVKATIEADPGMITVYPNPVKEDRLIQVSLSNMAKGVYQVSIINELGQTLMRKQLNHPGGNSVYPVRLLKGMAHGNYNLELTDENKTKTIFKVLY